MFVRKLILAFILLFFSVCLPHCTVMPDEIIHKQLFDLNWKFSFGNNKSASESDFNDVIWRDIDLPHDWSSEPTFKNLREETASDEIVLYRKNFDIPENWKGKKIELEFEGISAQHEIFVNGTPIQCSAKEKQNITAELTTKVNLKDKNLIVIRIKVPSESELKANTEAGIFGHVWLVIKESETKP